MKRGDDWSSFQVYIRPLLERRCRPLQTRPSRRQDAKHAPATRKQRGVRKEGGCTYCNWWFIPCTSPTMMSRLPSSSNSRSSAERVCSREYFEKSGRVSVSRYEHLGQVCRRLRSGTHPFRVHRPRLWLAGIAIYSGVTLGQGQGMQQ